MLEMPSAEMEENINAEIYDNPALEKVDDNDEDASWETGGDHDNQDGRDEIDMALDGIANDDDMPQVWARNEKDNAEYEEMVYGDMSSFYDKLK